jgi:hypothetical protein
MESKMLLSHTHTSELIRNPISSVYGVTDEIDYDIGALFNITLQEESDFPVIFNSETERNYLNSNAFRCNVWMKTCCSLEDQLRSSMACLMKMETLSIS